MSLLAKKTRPPEPAPYRFTVEEYRQLVESGFFKADDRLELIEGELIMAPSPSPEHAGTSNALRLKLERCLPENLLLRVADAIAVPPDSEPFPDFSIVPHRADFYSQRHPRSREVLLAIEIAKSTLAFDLGRKAEMYGRGGIREYWVLDLATRCLHVFTSPGKAGYRTKSRLAPGESVACGTIPQLKLAVAEMLL